MSDKDFVFRLGPFDDQDGKYVFYVYPGQPDNYAFEAASNAEGWSLISESYDLSKLTCEPMLASDSPAGVEEEPFDQYTEYAVALMVYQNLLDRPLRNVKLNSMFPDLVRASRDFLTKLATSEFAFEGLSVSLSGEPGVNAVVEVLGGMSPDDEIRFEFRDLDESGRRTTDVNAKRAQFSVRFRDDPSFASDAFQRAFSMGLVPIPVVGRKENEGTVNDTVLMLVIPTLTALEHAIESDGVALARYKLGNIDIEARARR